MPPKPQEPKTASDGSTDQELALAAAFRSELRQFLQRTETVAKRARLTPQRYDLLLMIKSADASGQGVRVTDLHPSMHLKQTAVTELVKRTEQAGLIDRRPSPNDGRVSLLRVTVEGERRLMLAFESLRDDRQALAAAFRALDQRFRAQSS